MKLKQTPTDFVVDELTDVVPTSGTFAFYRLKKSGWTTNDAIAELGRQWKIEPRRISIGGLKDRHAQTTQHFTIQNGPRKNWSQKDLNVNYLGQVEHPFDSKQIVANRFDITLRNLRPLEAKKAQHRLEQVRSTGLPNYFDDQRFGSVTGSEYPARLMVLGQYEEALKLVLTAPYEFDKAPAQRKKQLIRQHWGRWRNCLHAFERGSERSVFMHLVRNPDDFRGAVARLRPEMQGLYLAAYQSMVWNRMLASCIEETCGNQELGHFKLKTGVLPTPLEMSADQKTKLLNLQLPLPSARLPFDEQAVWAKWIVAALADQGHTLSAMKLPGLRKPFFSKGDRLAFVEPAQLAAQVLDDDRHLGNKKLRLKFELPRGSYATILVKRLTQTHRADNMSPSEYE